MILQNSKLPRGVRAEKFAKMVRARQYFLFMDGAQYSGGAALKNREFCQYNASVAAKLNVANAMGQRHGPALRANAMALQKWWREPLPQIRRIS